MNTTKIIKSEVQVMNVFELLAAYYSRILEQLVTADQAKSLVNAQCAFVALVMPIDLGYLYRIVALVWFAVAVLQCKIKMAD